MCLIVCPAKGAGRFRQPPVPFFHPPEGARRLYKSQSYSFTPVVWSNWSIYLAAHRAKSMLRFVFHKSRAHSSVRLDSSVGERSTEVTSYSTVSTAAYRSVRCSIHLRATSFCFCTLLAFPSSLLHALEARKEAKTPSGRSFSGRWQFFLHFRHPRRITRARQEFVPECGVLRILGNNCFRAPRRRP